MKQLSLGQEFKKGWWENNPVFKQVLGMCPMLAVTVNAENGTVEELRNVLTDLSASEAWQTAFAGTETYVLNNDNATSLVNKVEAAIVLNSN